MTWVDPRLSFLIPRVLSTAQPQPRTRLLARGCPGPKFSVLVSGSTLVPGNTCRSPAATGVTAVRLAEMALALGGTRQKPATGKSRTPPGAKAGPPSGPVASRVSKSRQEGTV